MRISKKEYYLNIAAAVAKRSTCKRRQYGAILVKDDAIVAEGYNGAPRGMQNCCDLPGDCQRSKMPHNSGDYGDCPAVHAEQNAIINAARHGTAIEGATLYLVGFEGDNLIDSEPCPICARMLANAGINELVLGRKE